MKRCLELARKSMKLGNAPVGSVIAKEDSIIGEGLELGKSKNDITFHAEIEAIRDALKNEKVSKLYKTTLYTTHEPCIMCSYTIRHYGIEKVVYGLSSKEIGGHTSEFALLNTASVSNWGLAPEIISGCMEEECLELNTIFTTQQEKK